jgi:adenine deaminase
MQTISANFVDLFNKKIFPATITYNAKIIDIKPSDTLCNNYIMPGFVDAHIHIESSMLVPSAFAAIAVKHGTVATVSDPHEIANVCGIEGVKYMIDNGNKVPFKFNFGAPSCVPATSFETSGAILDNLAVEDLLAKPNIKYLSEMMNYPGVLFKDEEVLLKIKSAQKHNKPIDGHAPGLMGEDAVNYIKAGISTDHECFTLEEALHKLKNGMKILIREGSAAKNFDALAPLLHEHYDNMMFCCDDKHPDELMEQHLNEHVKRAVDIGVDLFKVLQCACINPILHYKLDVGMLRKDDPADFIIVEDLVNFKVLSTYINGQTVYENGNSLIPLVPIAPINNFKCGYKNASEFRIPFSNQKLVQVIEALEGQLITKTHLAQPLVDRQDIISDIENDILQIAVVNRYKDAPVANALIKNFGLVKGAIASCVAHDCHNIIVIGTDTKDMAKAVNEVIMNEGGIAVCDGKNKTTLPLPIAGIMSDLTAKEVAHLYQECNLHAKALGCKLKAPFMTMSFMALLVIPQLKLSDLGLFDGGAFEFTSL